MINVNNIWWRILFVNPNSEKLMRSDSSYALAVTDSNDRCIYINDLVTGSKFDKVICHELCHVYSFSYSLDMPIQTEELIADFLATYGRDIFAVADDILTRFAEVA